MQPTRLSQFLKPFAGQPDGRFDSGAAPAQHEPHSLQRHDIGDAHPQRTARSRLPVPPASTTAARTAGSGACTLSNGRLHQRLLLALARMPYLAGSRHAAGEMAAKVGAQYAAGSRRATGGSVARGAYVGIRLTRKNAIARRNRAKADLAFHCQRKAHAARCCRFCFLDAALLAFRGFEALRASPRPSRVGIFSCHVVFSLWTH